ncbi:MAG: hypothetical protein ACOX4U_00190 [Anaerovoracaceae bacterium]|jgi:spore germination protein KB
MNIKFQNMEEPGHIKSIAFLFFIPPFFFIGTYFPISRSFWLALLLAALLNLPSIYVLARIFKRFPSPVAFRLLASVFAIIICIGGLYGFSNFIHSNVLPHTHPVIIPLILLILALYFSSQGLIPAGKFCFMSGLITQILFYISVLSSILKIDMFFLPRSFTDYFPIGLWNNRNAFIQSTLLLWAILLMQSFIMFALFAKSNKTFIISKEMTKGLISAIIPLSASYLTAVAVLGPNVLESLTYPLYYPPGLTGKAEYMERTEGILLTIFLLTSFIQTSLLFSTLRTLLPPQPSD